MKLTYLLSAFSQGLEDGPRGGIQMPVVRRHLLSSPPPSLAITLPTSSQHTQETHLYRPINHPRTTTSSKSKKHASLLPNNPSPTHPIPYPQEPLLPPPQQRKNFAYLLPAYARISSIPTLPPGPFYYRPENHVRGCSTGKSYSQ